MAPKDERIEDFGDAVGELLAAFIADTARGEGDCVGEGPSDAFRRRMREVLDGVTPNGVMSVSEWVTDPAKRLVQALRISEKYLRHHEAVDAIWNAGSDKPSLEKGMEDVRMDSYVAVIREKVDLSRGIDDFWDILEVLAYKVDNFPLSPSDPLRGLRMNRELLMAFLKVIRRTQNEDDLRVAIEERIASRNRSDSFLRRPCIADFRGASLPRAIPLISDFARKCEEHPDKIPVYEALIEIFHKMIKYFTCEKQRGYLTRGAQNGLTLFADAFVREAEVKKEDFTVFTSDREYMPMLSAVPSDKLHVVPYNRENPRNFINQLIGELSACRTGRVVCFLSSVCRDGTRILTPDIVSEIRDQCPDVEIWIDAAQDNMFFPDAHAVAYSKRMGRTGAGMMLLSNAPGGRYKSFLYDSALKVQSGYPTADVASTCGVLFAQRTRIGNRLSDLLNVGGLWHFRGKKEYIHSQAEKISTGTAQTPFGENFEARWSSEMDICDPNFWRYGKIISFFKRDGCPLSVKEVAAQLKKKFGIYVDWFSISDFEGWDKLLTWQISDGQDEDESIGEFFKKLFEFQEAHCDYLTGTIVLPEMIPSSDRISRKAFEQQKIYLEERAKDHEFLRIFINASMSPRDIDNLTEKLGMLDFTTFKSA